MKFGKKRSSTLSRLCIVLFLFCLFSARAIDAQTVAVVYPETREPYQSIFLSIIEGIEKGGRFPIKEYVLKPNEPVENILGWLTQEDIGTLIALGASGLELADKLPDAMRPVVGAVLINPDTAARDVMGITLAADPEVVFERLKNLSPATTRINVVYNPERNAWLIKRAQGAAQRRGLTLRVFPAKNIRESALVYREISQDVRAQADAIWLLQDETTLDEQAVLPFILKEAWDKNLVVFSSNPTHVKRGALFSLYPDNVGMGRSLAAMATKGASTENRDIVPLKDLSTAVNLRTADHLGLDLSSRDQSPYSLSYP
ncbi:MAG: ABC transporter substrate-binding protein [Gammaproteobacteria bacterium]